MEPPRINLLPGHIRERRLIRRQRVGIGAAAAALLVLLGIWYVVESRTLAEAREDAERERQVAVDLRARRVRLQPFADMDAQIAAARRMQTDVYAREIRMSGVMRDLSAIVPSNVWLTKMTASLTTAADAGAAPAVGTAPAGAQAPTGTTPGSPGASSPVASLTFAGAGFGHVDVGRFMRTLASGPTKDGQRVYLNPYFTSSQRSVEPAETPTVTFSASVDLSQAAFSGRFQADRQTGASTP
jgi:hypothetical protein